MILISLLRRTKLHKNIKRTKFFSLIPKVMAKNLKKTGLKHLSCLSPENRNDVSLIF